MHQWQSAMSMKWKYLARSALGCVLRRNMACPSCGSGRAYVVDRKWIVTTLWRCRQCKLLFRAPTSSESLNKEFYQAEYEQGFTTKLPDKAELQNLVRRS